jgi:hypothetical protein
MTESISAPIPDPRAKSINSGGGSGVFSPAWLGPLLQGITFATVVGMAYYFGAKLGTIQEQLGALPRIEGALNDPNTGIAVRLARLDERVVFIQNALSKTSAVPAKGKP